MSRSSKGMKRLVGLINIERLEYLLGRENKKKFGQEKIALMKTVVIQGPQNMVIVLRLPKVNYRTMNI